MVVLSMLLSEVAAELETQLSNAGVRVAVEAADMSWAPVDIRADRALVRNLIENAIQHSPKGGEIRCRVRGLEQE